VRVAWSDVLRRRVARRDPARGLTEEAHPLAPARGVVFGILLAVPLWAGIALLVRALF
jgi:hypothetical protein